MRTGARWLKRGDTFDPEDYRMTHRLNVALRLLTAVGVRPEFAPHNDACMLSEAQRSNKVFGFNYHCTCPGRTDDAIWPEWVTDDVFEHAFALADEVQTERGAYERGRAYEAKAARGR